MSTWFTADPHGSPPRAWGGLHTGTGSRVSKGITPTGVGRTAARSWRRNPRTDHPHGRGEDLIGVYADLERAGSPPRAWGGHPPQSGGVNLHRITPRAWGGRRVRGLVDDRDRITPTGVGRTTDPREDRPASPDYPHGRGEDVQPLRFRTRTSGSPPRAWGGLELVELAVERGRITPTGVGRTVIDVVVLPTPPDHPHGRGEDSTASVRTNSKVGSPPRAWGGPVTKADVVDAQWSPETWCTGRDGC